MPATPACVKCGLHHLDGRAQRHPCAVCELCGTRGVMHQDRYLWRLRNAQYDVWQRHEDFRDALVTLDCSLPAELPRVLHPDDAVDAPHLTPLLHEFVAVWHLPPPTMRQDAITAHLWETLQRRREGGPLWLRSGMNISGWHESLSPLERSLHCTFRGDVEVDDLVAQARTFRAGVVAQLDQLVAEMEEISATLRPPAWRKLHPSWLRSNYVRDVLEAIWQHEVDRRSWADIADVGRAEESVRRAARRVMTDLGYVAG